MDGLLEPPSDARRCHPIICSKNEITFPNTLVEAVVMGKTVQTTHGPSPPKEVQRQRDW